MYYGQFSTEKVIAEGKICGIDVVLVEHIDERRDHHLHIEDTEDGSNTIDFKLDDDLSGNWTCLAGWEYFESPEVCEEELFESEIDQWITEEQERRALLEKDYATLSAEVLLVELKNLAKKNFGNNNHH